MRKEKSEAKSAHLNITTEQQNKTTNSATAEINTKSIFNIKPIPQERIWGTDRMASFFHMQKSGQKYGEVILASAMDTFKVGDTPIDNGSFHDFYQKHREEFFKIDCEAFPLRINLIDTAQPLSIQVHPDQRTTSQYGLTQGINEFWFVIEAKAGATIEIGHKAHDLDHFIQANNEGCLNELLNYVTVHAGDYFFLPAGTLHAIGTGILIYELTYNIDLTYRIYDYERINALTGKKRELHWDKAMDVLSFPQTFKHSKLSLLDEHNALTKEVLIDQSEVFTVQYWQIAKEAIIAIDNFYLCTIIDGEGMIEGMQVTPFETWFVPINKKELKIVGDMKILAATFKQR